MSSDMTCRVMEDILLRNDAGHDIAFKGRLFSECSWYDDETGVLTRQKLYVTEDNEQIYYIVSGSGAARNRRAYRLRVEGDRCVINNGACDMSMQLDMLLLAVRGLCGLDAAPSDAALLASVEETLKAANG